MRRQYLIILFLVSSTILHSQDFAIAGKWVVAPGPHVFISYEFSDSGTVRWTVRNDSLGETDVFNVNYRLRPGEKFRTIDIYGFTDKRVQGRFLRGIVKVLTNDKILFDGTPSNHGGRPEKFSGEALVLTRVRPQESPDVSELRRFTYGGTDDTVGAVLSGKIVDGSDAAGTPLPGVTIRSFSYNTDETAQCSTDSAGLFTVRFDDGRYVVLISKPGYQNITLTNFNPGPDQVSELEAVLRKGAGDVSYDVERYSWTK